MFVGQSKAQTGKLRRADPAAVDELLQSAKKKTEAVIGKDAYDQNENAIDRRIRESLRSGNGIDGHPALQQDERNDVYLSPELEHVRSDYEQARAQYGRNARELLQYLRTHNGTCPVCRHWTSQWAGGLGSNVPSMRLPFQTFGWQDAAFQPTAWYFVDDRTGLVHAMDPRWRPGMRVEGMRSRVPFGSLFVRGRQYFTTNRFGITAGPLVENIHWRRGE